MVEAILSQLIALATFLAFPAIEYLILRCFTRREGLPELWYLPASGFRLVIRNLPRKRTLSAIRYRALLRRIVPASGAESSPTFVDGLLHERADFFLFPGTDQVLLAFTLEGNDAQGLWMISRDLRGSERLRKQLAEFDLVVCDYEATVENFFNFDARLATRVEITADRLRRICREVSRDRSERRFHLSAVKNVG